MFRLLLALATTLLLSDPLGAQSTMRQEAQWIVVVAPKLRAAINPLIEHRRARGFRVVVIDSSEAAPCDREASEWGERLRTRVCQTWQSSSGPSIVLLVGAPIVEQVDDPMGFAVPALQGTIARMAGRPSDNGYGCRDGRLLPSVAVGRFPARTAAEAEAMVRKTLGWETRPRSGLWKRRLVSLAGAPSYNPVVDGALEKLTMARFGELDPVWTGNAIYYNPNSYYTLPNEVLLEQAQAYLNQGQLLTVFLGHSNVDGFWFDRWSGPYFSSEDWASLKSTGTNGIFATFGCWATQYDGQGGEGYGIHAMRNPDGPVAVIGAHGECWAAMAMLFSEGLLKNLPGPCDTPRLADVWLAMKAELATTPLNPLMFNVLNAVDGDPNTPEATQRLEHQEMFTLLGDPAVRLPGFQSTLKVQCPLEVRPGQLLHLSVTLPPELREAVGWVRLERTLSSHPSGVQEAPEELYGQDRATLLVANHERANRLTLCETPLTINGSQASASVPLPPQLPWQQLAMRVYARSSEHEAISLHLIRVLPNQTDGHTLAP